jgi:hypothetical protein
VRRKGRGRGLGTQHLYLLLLLILTYHQGVAQGLDVQVQRHATPGA